MHNASAARPIDAAGAPCAAVLLTGERQIDSAILGLLIDSDAQRPWSRDEIEREIGSDTPDSLDRLYGVGLIHRVDRFVWATRAAMAADELAI